MNYDLKLMLAVSHHTQISLCFRLDPTVFQMYHSGIKFPYYRLWPDFVGLFMCLNLCPYIVTLLIKMQCFGKPTVKLKLAGF